LKQLAIYAKDPAEKWEFMNISDDKYQEIKENGLTLPQIFERFPSVSVPVGELIWILPRI